MTNVKATDQITYVSTSTLNIHMYLFVKLKTVLNARSEWCTRFNIIKIYVHIYYYYRTHREQIQFQQLLCILNYPTIALKILI